MQDFNVLKPNQKIFGHYFLEASAGTGKTFTIEHLFMRFILESKEININQILVITFTKKATFELISRIKSSLEKTLDNLKNNNLKNLPDYFQSHNDVKQFYNKLLSAYLKFPSNSIFTIHGFCYHLLKTFFIGKINSIVPSSKVEFLLDIVRKYLTQEQFFHLLNKEQIKKLISRYPKNLDLEITSYILQHSLKENIPSLFSIKKELTSNINKLKNIFKNFSFDDLFIILSHDLKKFKNTCNKKKQLKEILIENLSITIKNLLKDEEFFNQESWSCSPLIFFSIKNIKLNQQELHHISKSIIDLKISELLKNYFNTQSIISWISFDILEREIPRNSLIKEDDILNLTLRCLQQYPETTKKISKFYLSVLIDEFQDTDPIQWNIIKILFMFSFNLKHKCSLFLIGDPKQSIYGFRNADIYTYKLAQKNFSSDNTFSLKTNYRATPELVSVINFLFSKNENLFYLPKNNEGLSYHQLKSNPKNSFNYTRRLPCHFFIEQSEQNLFNFIYQEISYLVNKEKIPLNKIAILIKDQSQGFRFFNNCPFPVDTNKALHLSESTSIQILKSLLAACMNPHKIHLIIPVLIGPLFLKTTQEIIENLNFYMNLFFSYQKILYSSGVLELFHFLIKQQGEHLLKLHQGHSLYQEIEFLVDKLHEITKNPNNYLYLLEKYSFLGKLDDTLKANFSEISEEALQILTIHAAKGMEFEAVFPIGLIKSHSLLSSEDKEEILEEKIRQTYVAFTRAKTFLYIPILEKEEPFSPISLFLKRTLHDDIIENLIKFHPTLFSFSRKIEKHHVDYYSQSNPIEKPQEIKFDFIEKNKIISFSKIKKDSLSIKKETTIKQTSNNNFGLEFGSLCHLLLEKVNFSFFQKTTSIEQMKNLIEPFISSQNQLIWLEYIASLLFNLFNTLLKFPEDSFYLKDLNHFKIFKESEFLFLDDSPQTFVKGFIDLFFEHNNRFYIIDWKTSFLGEHSEDYSADKLLSFATKMQYDQQIQFYLKAAKKYLKLFSKEEYSCFGAIVFLRGLTNNTGLLCY